ncbi:MAG: endonuclease III domain-containing protein [Elusimicrobia bacterium]|nr:endonuclease III domain-containing protein [Elusimicrobiota bacterium]
MIRDIYPVLFAHYGPQRWWPGETPFEVCVGAILVQNTNWKNVEGTIAGLKARGLLSCEALLETPPERLAQMIRPVGYFNIKTKRLRNFLLFLRQRCAGDIRALVRVPWPQARAELLAVNGIGPETADSILLYALAKPVFVVDAYTRRLLIRHGFREEGRDYSSMQALFMGSLPSDVRIFNEYHALIVRLGKDFGRDAPDRRDYPLKERKYFLSVRGRML